MFLHTTGRLPPKALRINSFAPTFPRLRLAVHRVRVQTAQLSDDANPGMNMVVVEGGPKAVRAYVKLMTRRIRWGEEEYGGGDSDSDRWETITAPALCLLFDGGFLGGAEGEGRGAKLSVLHVKGGDRNGVFVFCSLLRSVFVSC